MFVNTGWIYKQIQYEVINMNSSVPMTKHLPVFLKLLIGLSIFLGKFKAFGRKSYQNSRSCKYDLLSKFLFDKSVGLAVSPIF